MWSGWGVVDNGDTLGTLGKIGALGSILASIMEKN